MSKPVTKTFRDLKTSFESRSKPTTATTSATPYHHRSVAGTSTNMSSDKPTRVVPTIAHSIDSVLDTPAAKPTVRPTAKLRPSWIGPPPPERPTTPGISTMKQHIVVEYSSPGLRPPVYIFTSLSDPQWDAVEMQPVTKDHVEYKFYKTFDAEEGEYQYKFRLGPGDWWVFDESKPTVDDGQGNKNNLLVVRPEPSKPAQPASEGTDSKVAGQTPHAIPLPQPEPQVHAIITPAPEEKSVPTPLLKHETFVPNRGSEAQQTPEREIQDPFANEESPDDVESSVLMKHEGSALDNKEGSELAPDVDDDALRFEGDDGLEESNSSPLLRHESVAPSSKEQEQAPLFRHESIAIGYNHHEPPAAAMSPTRQSRHASSAPLIPVEADSHDPSLEKFPTDHAGIVERIHRTSKALAEDETLDDTEHGSPHSQALSETSVSIPSLPSVREAEDEELEKIREAEEEEYEKEKASGDEMDPLRPAAPMTPPLTPKEPEDADFEPKVSETEKVEINETIIIEVVEERKSFFVALLDKLGGQGNAIVLGVGMLVLAAGLSMMQFL